MRLPSWSWAFVLFRFADGLSHAILPVYPVFALGMDIWAVPLTAAVMNVAAVPGSFAWGALMDRTGGVGRRRLAMGGFLASALAMAALAWGLPFAGFLVAAALFSLLGVATAPAASALVLEAAPGKQWGEAAGRLARRTGYAFLVAATIPVVMGLAGIGIDVLAPAMFAATVLLCLAAAVTAALTIEPAKRRRGRREPRVEAVPLMQRWFDRAVWFPSRLRVRPMFKGIQFADGDVRRFMAAYFLMFAGSSLLFAGYPGLLAAQGLSIGVVLLAQMPSHILAPPAQLWAGRLASRVGDMRIVGIGLWSRVAAVPGMCAILLLWDPLGWVALPLVMAWHALAGLSFAYLQIGGCTAVAKAHRAGRGAGVGNFHAAVGVGTMVGSAAGFVLLLAAPFAWAALAVTVLLMGGAGLAASVRNSRHFDERNVT